MSNTSSSIIDEVIENVVEEILREKAEPENQENSHAEEFKQEAEEIKIEVEAGEVISFYSEKGVNSFKKYLSKKGYVEERGFKKLLSPFKEEVERRGWEIVSQYIKPGRRAIVKEFYANLGERKDLTCYVRGRWIPFGERAISRLLKLRPKGDCMEYEQL